MMKNTLLAIALFFGSNLLADHGWNDPVTVFPLKGTSPYIIANDNGISVAIWYDAVDNVLCSATTSNGSEWVQTDPIADQIFVPTTTTEGLPIGIDASGTVFVSWLDQNNGIYVSSLPAGQQAWDTTIQLNAPSEIAVGYPTLAVDLNGSVIVVWTSQNKLFSNAYNSSTETWQGLSSIAIPNGTSVTNQVIFKAGQAISIVSQSQQDVHAYTFSLSTNQWTALPTLPASANFSTIALDASRNGYLLFSTEDGAVQSAFLPIGIPTFVNLQTLSVDGLNSAPCIQVTPEGYAIACWAENGSIASSRYSSISGAWTPLQPIRFQGQTPSQLALFLDENGNSLLSWTLTTGMIQTAALATNRNAWQVVSTISPSLENQRNCQTVINVNGNALAIWENDVVGTLYGNIESALFPGLFAAPETLSPINFSGEVLQHRQSSQVASLHRLSWEYNPNPVISQYVLLRNGEVLGAFDSGSLYYIYDDYGRASTDTYTVFSLTATNVPSTPISVTLPNP